ncbi:hypothetical protein AQS70_13210 [Pseudomonas endophytica]|uniref:Lipoprotein n=1 Tax=Pseudomonas endophytica TaxID=1563157 RepID=A0A0Q0X725_9PSED|nr:hypothetical protein [Pseudomonas endophytica]KQB52806.1 hypothetical protein AQS70_13210 [Pseudomonas endophytica]
MKSFNTLIALTIMGTLAIGLSGCQVIKPAESDLKEKAETQLGNPVTEITNIRSDFNTTYFTAKTASGSYACQLPSGPMVALGSMGMGLGAQCTKQ